MSIFFLEAEAQTLVQEEISLAKDTYRKPTLTDKPRITSGLINHWVTQSNCSVQKHFDLRRSWWKPSTVNRESKIESKAIVVPPLIQEFFPHPVLASLPWERTEPIHEWWGCRHRGTTQTNPVAVHAAGLSSNQRLANRLVLILEDWLSMNGFHTRHHIWYLDGNWQSCRSSLRPVFVQFSSIFQYAPHQHELDPKGI